MARTLEPNFIQKTTQNRPLRRSQMSLTHYTLQQRFYYRATAAACSTPVRSEVLSPHASERYVSHSAQHHGHQSSASVAVVSFVGGSNPASLGRKTGFWLRSNGGGWFGSGFFLSGSSFDRRLVSYFLRDLPTTTQTNELMRGMGSDRERIRLWEKCCHALKME